MLDVVPFRPVHLIDIAPRPDEAGAQQWVSPAEAVKLMGPHAYTLVVDGVAVGCAGLARPWRGRYIAWAYFDVGAGKYLLPFVRRVRAYLDTLGPCRIEATVVATFGPGHRLARLCGFIPYAAPLERYMPNGDDAILYRRLQ